MVLPKASPAIFGNAAVFGNAVGRSRAHRWGLRGTQVVAAPTFLYSRACPQPSVPAVM